MNYLQWHNKIKQLLLIIFTLILLVFALTAMAVFSLNYIKPQGLIAVDNKAPLVIDNINIVMVKTNQVLKNRQLVIQQGVITAINMASSSVKLGTRIIDADGAYVTPGLFDMHVHIHDRKYLMLNLAYGVTSVRNLRGQKMHLRWKQELQNAQWLGSNLYTSSPVLAGHDTHLLNQKVLSPEHGKEEVRKAKANGYDFIKVYGYLAPDIFEAIIEEAHRIDIAIVKHGPHPANGSDWSYLQGVQSLEHVEDVFQGILNYQFDEDALQNIALKFKALNVSIVPTLATFNHLTRLSNEKNMFINGLDTDYLNPLYFDIERHFSVARWLQDDEHQSAYHLKKQQFLFDIVRVLNKQKVKLLVGSDAGTMYTVAGIATHNEMKLLKLSGLSDYEVLKAATINAAETLTVDHKFGSVDVGKIADLVIVKHNPLDDITVLNSPYAVVKNGQWLGENTLKKLKASAKNTDSYFWSLINFIEDLFFRFAF
jgi:hypothetical protein